MSLAADTTSHEGPPDPPSSRRSTSPAPTWLRVPSRRVAAGGTLLVAVGLVMATWLAGSGRAAEATTVRLGSASHQLGVALPVHTTGLTLGVLSCLGGVAFLLWPSHTTSTTRAAAAQCPSRVPARVRASIAAFVSVGFVLSLLTWAAAGSGFSCANLLAGSVDRSLPIILGACAGLVCERAGVVNVAIEGQMLAGAWASALFATIFGSLVVGVALAGVAGALTGALLAVLAIRYLVDQVVIGIVINLLVLGLTGFLINGVMTDHADALNNPGVFTVIKVPFLCDLPIVGKALFTGTVFLYVTYLLVAVLHVGLFRTRWGLRLRAVGEHPVAAETVAIDVRRTRFRAVVIGGAIAGVGGAYFTLGNVGAFGDMITSGKGFIALAAVIFGRWRPLGAVTVGLLFGFMDALQSLLAALDTPVPSQLLTSLPYLVTLLVVAGIIGHAHGPAAVGKPFGT